MVAVVWSEDGVAARMVGCGRLIRMDYDNAGGKSGTHIRLHLVEKILEQDKLGRQGSVLFAALSGGSYA